MIDKLYEEGDFVASPAIDELGQGKTTYRILFRDEERRVMVVLGRNEPGHYFWPEVPFDHELLCIISGAAKISVGGDEPRLVRAGEAVSISDRKSLRIEADEDVKNIQVIRF